MKNKNQADMRFKNSGKLLNKQERATVIKDLGFPFRSAFCSFCFCMSCCNTDKLVVPHPVQGATTH